MITEMYDDSRNLSVHDFIGSIVDELIGEDMPTEERDELILDIMNDMKKMIHDYLFEY